jgi:Protein of unknown function (DUF3300)
MGGNKVRWRGGRFAGRGTWVAAALLTVALAVPPLEGAAQESDASLEVEDVELVELEALPDGALSDEELQALVAPIALYPDLVLVLTLQASLAPLDVVQADRFLASYAEDPSLEPDPDWDESVFGLLNYPTVVGQMSADLDWIGTLGNAVIDQLEGVQDAVQEIRGFMRALGALESNEQMIVIADGDIIRIEPTDPDAVFIPQYDPDALLAAFYGTDAAPALTGAEAPAEPEPEAVEEVQEEAGVVTETVEAVAPATTTVETVPAYYPAVAPPPVTYSDPSPSWLGTAATFAGGAVVGGLVGWAIADDDDDNHNNNNNNNSGDRYSRGNVNIEDSTIVVNRGDRGRGDDLDDLRRKAQNDRLKRDARDKAQRKQTKRQLEQRFDRQGAQARVGGQRGGGELATAGARRPIAATRGSTGSKQVAKGRSGKKARAGDRKQPQVASAFGGGKSASKTKQASKRGLKSRSGAKTAVKPDRSRGGGAFAQRGGGKAKGGKGRGGKQRKKKGGGKR